MIIITATWKAKQGKEKELQGYLEKMVENVKANEPDCLEYTLHQGSDDKSIFFYYEKYNDEKAIDFHKNTDHFKSLISNTKDLIQEDVDIHLLNIIKP